MLPQAAPSVPGSTAPSAPADQPERHVVIAALTCRRPLGLARLLGGLAQVRPVAGIRTSVVIVDNCPEGSAQAAVAAMADKMPFPLTYFHEPERGLTPARNRAVTSALDVDADYLAFIDDDEVPGPRWLAGHVQALRDTGADASMGAVRAQFNAPPPGWIQRGAFHDTAGMRRYQRMSYGSTSNILFDLEPVRRTGLRFHPAFSLTGGEDAFFFDSYLRSGGVIVFNPDAEVKESVGPERATLGWLMRRWRRTGGTSASLALTDRRGVAAMTARVRCAVAGLGRVIWGTVTTLATLPAAAVGHFELPARQLRIAMRGLGFIDALRGRVIEEYRPTSK